MNLLIKKIIIKVQVMNALNNFFDTAKVLFKKKMVFNNTLLVRY
jgi:hypothetical protein